MSAIRPGDLALFLLASGDLLPRRRARDQQADLAGLALKRRVLNMLVLRDPDPAELDAALTAIIAEVGPPDGPTRAICRLVREEWELAGTTPTLTDWLIDEALRSGEGSQNEGRRGRKSDQQDAGAARPIARRDDSGA